MEKYFFEILFYAYEFLPAFLYVHQVQGCGLQRSDEGSSSLKRGLTGGSEPPLGLGTEPGSPVTTASALNL